MARTLDDVLARRIRALQLDVRAALEAAPRVAELLARELGRNRAWVASQLKELEAIARNDLPEGAVAEPEKPRPIAQRPTNVH
jgi:glycerol-3-phosphate dehydrogenase